MLAREELGSASFGRGGAATRRVKRLEIMHEADIRRLQWVIRMAELAPQSVPSVPGVGGFTALVHEQLLRNESCAQRGVRIHRE